MKDNMQDEVRNTLNFISSFQKQGVILLLQLCDVAEGLVQNHVLALQKSRYRIVWHFIYKQGVE